jgi:TonB family protein
LTRARGVLWAPGVGALRSLFVACLCIFTVLAEHTFGQQSKFDKLAANLADAIKEASLGNATAPTVRVADFRELHGAPSQLGDELANEFAEALFATPRNFVVRSRGERMLKEAAATSSAEPPAKGSSEDVCKDARPSDEATLVVDGELDDLPDRIVLRLKATRTSDGGTIFDQRVMLPLNSKMKVLISKPRPAPNLLEDAVKWVRPGYVSSKGEESRIPAISQEKSDYIGPSCIYCARAGYPDEAERAKIQGVVTLRVLVSKDGDPMEIEVVNGLPCGLNQAAIDAVEEWRLKPATTADGTPIAVWQEIGVTFQLY